jgi:hypothetical protein
MTQEQQHPITPPPELVGQWLCSDDYPWGPLEQTSMTITANRLQNIATQAAQWGADQELEACVKLANEMLQDGNSLRAARRPKPPSLKERSLQLLKTYNTSGVMLTADQADTIRLALEALND